MIFHLTATEMKLDLAHWAVSLYRKPPGKTPGSRIPLSALPQTKFKLNR